VSDEDAADAVGRVLDRVEQLPFEVDAILADRGYYQERVIRRARATAPVVLPVIKRENGFSINSTHTPPTGPEYAMYKGKETELQFRTRSVSPTTTATAARTAKSSVDMWRAILTDRTPKQVETLYRKRSAIETSYRTYREARATTTTPDPLIRFCTRRCGLFCCGRNLWLVVRWTIVARPRRAGATFQPNSRSNWCVAGSETILEHRA